MAPQWPLAWRHRSSGVAPQLGSLGLHGRAPASSGGPRPPRAGPGLLGRAPAFLGGPPSGAGLLHAFQESAPIVTRSHGATVSAYQSSRSRALTLTALTLTALTLTALTLTALTLTALTLTSEPEPDL